MDSARACLLQLDTVVAKSGVLETVVCDGGRGRDRCLTRCLRMTALDDAPTGAHGMMPL